QNITIKNVNIDWDIPLTAQAQVQAITNDYVDIAINAYEHHNIMENKKVVFVDEGWKSAWWGAMEFDGHTKLVTPQTGDAGCMGENFNSYKATELEKGLVRIQYSGKGKPVQGNWLVMRHSARDHSGTFIINSK